MRDEKDKQPIDQTKPANENKESKCNNGSMVPNNTCNGNGTKQLSNFGIVVSNATAKWSDTQTDNTLENINLTVRPGRLIAIIGPVGAGKV